MTTEKFIGLGKLEARALGVPELHFELIPHPLGGLEPSLARERGDRLGRAVVAYLRSRAA